MRPILALATALTTGLVLGSACGSDDDGDKKSGSGGGTSDGGTDAPVAAFCEGPTSFQYEPTAARGDAFPDDYFTKDDPGDTGVRVSFVDGENINLPEGARSFAGVWEDLSLLDGFGVTGGVTMTFSGPLDAATFPGSGRSTGTADESVVLVRLGDGAPELVPFDWQLVDHGDGSGRVVLVADPLVPLDPKTRYGFAVTSRARDANGDCIAPSADMRALLAGTAEDPSLVRITGRIEDLVAALTDVGTITSAEDVSAAVVFTSQSTIDDSVAIAGQIKNKTVPYTAVDNCTDSGNGYLICEGTFEADDYRSGSAIDPSRSAQSTNTLKVTTYLPDTGTPPFKTIVFGHGLGGERQQAEQLAELAAPAGFATVAIDAVKHGEHPDGPSGTIPVIDFFGLSLNLNDPLDSLALRDHWRQSTYDKLHLVEMLRPGVDVTGDGTADVGIDNLAYLGVSLGGIMAAEFLAFAPEVKVAIPIVSGARVATIIRDAPQFSIVIDIFRSQASDGDVAGFFPILQAAIDRGDAGAYTRHVVADRLPGFDSSTPQVLMEMVLDDDTVPNGNNLLFARGLGIPLVGDELLPVGVIPHEPTLPTSGNIDATHTAGLFQYDVVLQGTGPGTQPATHSNVARNALSVEQSLHFIDTFLQDGVSEIIDPYRTNGVK